MSEDPEVQKRREERKKREEARRLEEEEEERKREERRKQREARRKELEGIEDPKKEESATTDTSSPSKKRRSTIESSSYFGSSETKSAPNSFLADEGGKGQDPTLNANDKEEPTNEDNSDNNPSANTKDAIRNLVRRRASLPPLENEAPPSGPLSDRRGSVSGQDDKNLRRVRSSIPRTGTAEMNRNDTNLRRRDSGTLETTIQSIGFDVEERSYSFHTENDSELMTRIQKKWKLKPEEFEIFDLTPNHCLLLPVQKITVFFDDAEGELHRINLKLKPTPVLQILASIMGFPENQYVLSSKKSPDSKFYLNPKKSLQDQNITNNCIVYVIKDATEAQKQIKKAQSIFSSKKKEEEYSPQIAVQKLGKLFDRALRSAVLSPYFSKSMTKSGAIDQLFVLLTSSSKELSREHIILFIDILLSHDEEALQSIGSQPACGRKLVTCYKIGTGDGTFLKEIILGIMSNLCIDYLPKVLDGLKFLDEVRFTSLVDDINATSDLNFKSTILFFINTILASMTSVEQRVFTREELFSLDFASVLEKLRNMTHPDLEEQIQIFEEDQLIDKEELNMLAEKSFKGVDYKDIDSLWPALRTAVQKDAANEERLLSVLKRLLTVTEADDINDEQRKSIWQTIDKIVERLVNMEENETPETMFISHEEFQIMRQNNDDKVEELRKKITALEKGEENPRLKELEEKLENVQNERREFLQNKIQLEEKVKSLEQQLLKNQGSGAQVDPNAPPAPPPMGAEVDPNAPPAPPMMGAEVDPNAPPAPPPPMMGLDPNAPPPPPPPMGMGMSGDPNAPPPPPAPFGKMGQPVTQGLPNLPNKPVIKPKTKLKKLNWKKIPNNKILSTIWVEAKEEIPLDIEMIESTFAAKENKTMRTTTTSLRPKKASVLDGKRSNHMGISLTKFKLEMSQIKEAIVHLDDSKITYEQVSMLTGPSGFLPSQDEINAVLEFPGGRDMLDKPEQFVLELSSVPLLNERVQFWATARSFEERVHALLPNINTLIKSFKEAMTSTKLVKVFEIILAVGNYLNGGTFNGRAYGFTLESLLKLIDTKSTDPKFTLLHFVIKTAEQKYPNALEWQRDLTNLEKASKIPESVLKEEITSLKNGVTQALQLLKVVKAQNPLPEENVELLLRLEKFGEQADQKQKVIEATMKELYGTFERLCLKFGEEPDKFKIEEFFQMFMQFTTQWNQAKKDLEQMKQDINKKPVGRIGKRTALKKRGNDQSEQPAEEEGKETPTQNLKKRVEVRRTESIRRVSESRSSKRNLNNLLDMLNTMEK